MPSANETGLFSLDNWLHGGTKIGADLGPVDGDREGAYRLGFHQATAEVMFVLKGGGQLTAESLARWVEEDGKKCRQDTALGRKIIALALPKS